MAKAALKRKRGYMDYRIQLQLLRGYLQEKRKKKEPLAAFELDMRMGKVLAGYKEAGLTDEQLQTIEEDKVTIFEKYGKKTKKGGI